MIADLWRKLNNNAVQCFLCQHGCHIPVGETGLCAVRGNKRGQLYSLASDRVATIKITPIESNPFYHYLPGTKTYALGTVGCNFSCQFCNNYEISRIPTDKGIIQGKKATPEALVHDAMQHKISSISFTHNEPTVFYELMYEVSGRATAFGLDCLLVTNGYQSPECLSYLYHRIKAANVDLKSMSNSFYDKYCQAKLNPVLDSLKIMVKMGWWVEVTTLIIPRCNDSDDELREAARFIRDELGPHVPWHVSRFYGAYHMNGMPPTPSETLERARKIGLEEGLYYVYIGNVGYAAKNVTTCPECQTACVTRRTLFQVNKSRAGICPQCGRNIEGVWHKV